MKNNQLRLLLILVSVLIIGRQTETVNCKIKTTEGAIIVELYPEKAPHTVANFLRYVDAGIYDDSAFFRVCNPQNEVGREIQIEVIQGGLTDESKDFSPIKMESTKETGIQHENGSISMARMEPHTATNNFFICIGDQPELDFEGKRNPDGQGFAAFGKVTEGMNIVMEIQKQKDTSQYLIDPIRIESIRRIK